MGVPHAKTEWVGDKISLFAGIDVYRVLIVAFYDTRTAINSGYRYFLLT